MSQAMDRRVSPACRLTSVDRVSIGGIIAADDPCSPARYRHQVRHRRFKARRPVLARLMKLAAMPLAVLVAPHDGHRSGGQLHLIRADQLLADRIFARALQFWDRPPAAAPARENESHGEFEDRNDGECRPSEQLLDVAPVLRHRCRRGACQSGRSLCSICRQPPRPQSASSCSPQSRTFAASMRCGADGFQCGT